MNYIAYLFLNHLISVSEETRFVDGREQVCLVIPTETNQLKRGKQGNWLMTLRISESQPNAAMRTHVLQLGYLNYEEVGKAKNAGAYERSQRIGNVYEHDHTPSKKVNRTNNATNIKCYGKIVLSDIPKDLIFSNAENAKRYVSNLHFKFYSDRHRIYTGCVCIDDIPRDEIRTDADTGKKYINAAFKRMPKLDTYMNTHHLVIMTKDGSEVEIGRFKEWVAEDKTESAPPPASAPTQEHTTTVNPRDTSFSIDGIKF